MYVASRKKNGTDGPICRNKGTDVENRCGHGMGVRGGSLTGRLRLTCTLPCVK